MMSFRRPLCPIALTAAAALTMAGATGAHAVCAPPATQLTGDTLAAAVGGKTVCVPGAGGWNNQEYHAGSAGGDIVDYKKGPGDRIDPSKTIGSWAIIGTDRATITYNYGSATYSYTVWQQGNGSLDFCNGTSPAVSGATVRNGLSNC